MRFRNERKVGLAFSSARSLLFFKLTWSPFSRPIIFTLSPLQNAPPPHNAIVGGGEACSVSIAGRCSSIGLEGIRCEAYCDSMWTQWLQQQNIHGRPSGRWAITRFTLPTISTIQERWKIFLWWLTVVTTFVPVIKKRILRLNHLLAPTGNLLPKSVKWIYSSTMKFSTVRSDS